MIEIELKYELHDSLNIEIPKESIKIVEDIYYDTKDYQLLKNGNFLRIRNNKQLDFKLNANDLSHLYCKETNFDFNQESLPEINKVLNSLGIDINLKSLEELSTKLKVLAPIKKKRTSYKLEENVTMVIDEVTDLGNFLEIEYDLNKEEITKEEGIKYQEYLLNVLKNHHLYNQSMQKVQIGYVELYLKKYNLTAYKLGLYQE